MKKHPVVWFYILAFAISWLGWLPMVASSRGIALFTHPLFQMLLLLPAIGPALAAVVVTAVNEGKAGIDRLFRPLGKWRVGATWLIIAVAAPALFLLAGKPLSQVSGLASKVEAPAGNLIGMAIGTFVMSLLSNTWEEVGWRGFALPRLQKNYNALLASLVVGVLWGLWHLPLFFWQGNPMSNYPFHVWFVGTVALSLIYTWLYNSTEGSLFVVTLFHVFTNTFGVLISGISVTALTMIYFIISVLLVVIFGKENLAQGKKVHTG
jgi:membrane protease YdiL (CAAX protease family)